MIVIGTVMARSQPATKGTDGGATPADDEMSQWTPPAVAPRLRRSGWRSAAFARYLALADQIVSGSSENQVERARAADQLRQAATAFETTDILSWWSGVADTEVLGALDRSERHLVPSEESARKVYSETLRVRLGRRFKAEDARGKAALKLLDDATRPSVQGALDILHGGSLSLRSTQRFRRNTTFIMGVLILLAVGVLSVSIGHGVGGLSLAMATTTTTTITTATAGTSTLRSVDTPDTGSTVGIVSPAKNADKIDATDKETPPVASAWAVAVFGAVGAVLSLVALRLRANGVARAGGGWTVQALLKIAAGALTALLAAVFVQQLDVRVIKPQEAPRLLAWALVFGYAQDIVTKKLDDRIAAIKAPAESATETTPEKD